jgi:septum formation protein
VSPRRKALLEGVGIPVIVHPSGVDENHFQGKPEQVVTGWATRKAEAVAGQYAENPVLGADTMVYLGGEPLGKPRDPEEAAGMLAAMSGRRHSVFGGVCIIHGNRRRVFHRVTEVRFRVLTSSEIRSYVASGEPMDKAGAYGAQGLGACSCRRSADAGSIVVGLPLPRWSLNSGHLNGVRKGGAEAPPCGMQSLPHHRYLPAGDNAVACDKAHEVEAGFGITALSVPPAGKLWTTSAAEVGTPKRFRTAPGAECSSP